MSVRDSATRSRHRDGSASKDAETTDFSKQRITVDMPHELLATVDRSAQLSKQSRQAFVVDVLARFHGGMVLTLSPNLTRRLEGYCEALGEGYMPGTRIKKTAPDPNLTAMQILDVYTPTADQILSGDTPIWISGQIVTELENLCKELNLKIAIEALLPSVIKLGIDSIKSEARDQSNQRKLPLS